MRQSPNSGKPEFSHSNQPSHRNQIARFLFVVLFLVCVPYVKAQSDPNMSGVDDVLGSQRTILQVDDIFTLQGIQLLGTFFAAESISQKSYSGRTVVGIIGRGNSCEHRADFSIALGTFG
jgi:hypothetical protein